MKKILVSLLLGLSLVGCSAKDISKEDLNGYIEKTIVENENISTLYHYGNIEKEEFETHFQEQIDYINKALEVVDDLDTDTINFATEYVNHCNTLLHSGKSKHYNIITEMNELYDEYVKEDDTTEKETPSKKEGWEYTVEGLERASSYEQMEIYVNYCLKDGRRKEEDTEILKAMIEQVDIVLAENEVEENLLNYFNIYRECCVELLNAETDIEYEGALAKLRISEMFK